MLTDLLSPCLCWTLSPKNNTLSISYCWQSQLTNYVFDMRTHGHILITLGFIPRNNTAHSSTVIVCMTMSNFNSRCLFCRCCCGWTLSRYSLLSNRALAKSIPGHRTNQLIYSVHILNPTKSSGPYQETKTAFQSKADHLQMCVVKL